MLHDKKKVPGWNDVLEAFQTIKGDPLLLGTVKEKLLLILIRSIMKGSYISIGSCWKSLKKYGVVLEFRIPRSTGNTMLDMERFRALHRQHQADAGKTSDETDWPEAVDLARALDLLSEKMGTDSNVKDFLYKFKILLWHRNLQNLALRLRTVFTYGEKQYRIWAVWFILQNRNRNLLPEDQFYSLSTPPDLRSRLRAVSLMAGDGCHHSICSGELNVFVLYAMSSKRPLAKKDFWGIMYYGRSDFLEFLLIDLPNKKLPYSIDEIISITASRMQYHEDFGVKVFQLVERIEPGKIASFTDQYGGNWLWYSLFILSQKINVTTDGTVPLSPLQKYLYSLCDHAKPNCDGISFDDLYLNYPVDLFKSR